MSKWARVFPFGVPFPRLSRLKKFHGYAKQYIQYNQYVCIPFDNIVDANFAQ